jgi:hypothetical protein
MRKLITARRAGYCLTLCLLALVTVSARGQWVQTNGPFGADVLSFTQSGTTLFAGTGFAGVFRSEDNGAHWTSSSNGLTSIRINALTVLGTDLFAGSDKGVARSTDNGATWTETSYRDDLDLLTVGGTELFAVSAGVLSHSTDNGTSWTVITTVPGDVDALQTNGTNLLAAINGLGTYGSTDAGATWTAVGTGLPSTVTVASLFVTGTGAFAGTDHGAYRSTDIGLTWVPANIGLTDSTDVVGFAQVGTSLLAATVGQGVVISTDNGATWSETNTGMVARSITTLFVSGTKLFAGTSGNGNGVYISTNNGASWTAMSNGLLGLYTTALAVDGANLYAGTSGGLLVSTDDGESWSSINNGLPLELVGAILKNGTDLFVGTAPYTSEAVSGGVYHSTDNGITWTKSIVGGGNVVTLARIGTNLFAGTDGSGVFLSTDNGTTWNPMNSGLSSLNINFLMPVGTSLFAATSRGVNISTDNGASWTSGGLTSTSILTFARNGTDLFVGAFGNGTARSTNNGTSWIATNSGLTSRASKFVYAIVPAGGNLFAATGDGVYHTSNNGGSWEAASTGMTTAEASGVGSLVVKGGNLFASGGLFAGDLGIWKRPLSDFAGTGVRIVDSAPATIELSPNPTRGTITLTAVRAGERIEIMNLVGERVMAVAGAGGSERTIDLAELPAGTYFIRISDGRSARSTMIVKE